jgi:hypothetical protein
MNIALKGRTAIVTGSMAGIGRATAEGLARAGASVVINGHGNARVSEAVQQTQQAFPENNISGIYASMAAWFARRLVPQGFCSVPPVRRRQSSRAVRSLAFKRNIPPKRKSLPREEVRQAFRKEPNSDWEEECRRSDRRPLGGGADRLNSKLCGRRCIASIKLSIRRPPRLARVYAALQLCKKCGSEELRSDEYKNRSSNVEDPRKNARVISGRRAVLETRC